MCRKLFLLVSFVLLLAFCGTALANLVVNPSFEQPDLGDVSSMALVPGWTGEDAAGNINPADASVMEHDASWPAKDGDYSGYCSNHSSVPNRPATFYQNLGHNIVAGEQYTLTFWGASSWYGQAYPQGHLYYDNNGERVVLASSEENYMGGTWTELQASFTAQAGEDYIGKSLGIEFTPVGPHYVSVDDISVIPEPCTMALLGLGGLALIRRKR